jgi:ABC-2 type transport system permease protein
MADPLAQATAPLSPLSLLIRVNALSSWRRLKAVRDQSRLLTAVISLFIATYLVVSFWLFHVGLKFVAKFPGLGTLLMERLLFLLFAFLFILLLISNLVISYTNLFRNRETSFLLALPVPTQTIFQWKFIESTLLASWAFLFLIAPLLAAYGLIQNVQWHFYPMTLGLVAIFIVLPATVGSFAAINVARFLDRRLFQVCAAILMGAIICGAAFWFRPDSLPSDSSETRVLAVLDKMLLRTRFAQYPLLPSYWISSSVLHWGAGAVAASSFFLLVLLSHVLFFGMLSFTCMGNLFYDAASAVSSRGSIFARWKWLRGTASSPARDRPRIGFVERMVGHLFWLEPDVRALVVKDTLTFWRDTTQWAQSLMLFGLLSVYIFNLRQFSQQLNQVFWMHLVSYLNLGACSLNLATLTTRFVYPQFSLEGKRLWIVGMAPLGMVRVVKTKYWLAAWTSLVVTLSLIWLSCHMLEMPWPRIVFFAVAITIMTFTLTGLAVGLGTLYPNFKEENPSKIVSGFGGTFCLVLSFLYILGSVVLLAFASPWSAIVAPSKLVIFGCLAGFATLSALLGWLPLALGLRRLRHFEM